MLTFSPVSQNNGFRGSVLLNFLVADFVYLLSWGRGRHFLTHHSENFHRLLNDSGNVLKPSADTGVQGR